MNTVSTTGIHIPVLIDLDPIWNAVDTIRKDSPVLQATTLNIIDVDSRY